MPPVVAPKQLVREGISVSGPKELVRERISVGGPKDLVRERISAPKERTAWALLQNRKSLAAAGASEVRCPELSGLASDVGLES